MSDAVTLESSSGRQSPDRDWSVNLVIGSSLAQRLDDWCFSVMTGSVVVIIRCQAT